MVKKTTLRRQYLHTYLNPSEQFSLLLRQRCIIWQVNMRKIRLMLTVISIRGQMEKDFGVDYQYIHSFRFTIIPCGDRFELTVLIVILVHLLIKYLHILIDIISRLRIRYTKLDMLLNFWPYVLYYLKDYQLQHRLYVLSFYTYVIETRGCL